MDLDAKFNEGNLILKGNELLGSNQYLILQKFIWNKWAHREWKECFWIEMNLKISNLIQIELLFLRWIIELSIHHFHMEF